MEEDIKVLEKYVEKDIPCNSCKYCTERPKVAGALRNLIKRYKELEEENKSLTDSYLIQKDLINEEILRERKQFYEGELYTAKQLKNIERDRNKYFIHKSKVREKIEEANKEIKQMEQDDIGVGFTLGNRWSDLKAKVKGWEELLQKGDTNATKM